MLETSPDELVRFVPAAGIPKNENRANRRLNSKCLCRGDWPSRAASGRGLTSGTFYSRLQPYPNDAGLSRAGVHVFRHSAAKLRRDADESVEAVSAFLDHSSLQVTSVYLRRLEGIEDKGWSKVAQAIGL